MSHQRGGLTTSPVIFNIKDSPQVNQLKALVSAMISFNPKERPSIDEVLDALQAIAGKLHLLSYFTCLAMYYRQSMVATLLFTWAFHFFRVSQMTMILHITKFCI